jgi:hypothetical protein
VSRSHRASGSVSAIIAHAVIEPQSVLGAALFLLRQPTEIKSPFSRLLSRDNTTPLHPFFHLFGGLGSRSSHRSG